MSARLDLSVIIITLNEEKKLDRCLSSLPTGAEIILIDSFSKDQTINIAQKYGAQVHQRHFTNYSDQKNSAISLCTRPWILAVDADEALNPELRKSLELIFRPPSKDKIGLATTQIASTQIDGFTVKRRLVFNGRLLRFGKSSDRPLRLFRRGAAQYQGVIHEKLNIENERCSKWPEGLLEHLSYDDLTDYFHKFNHYTSAIAKQHINKGTKPPSKLTIIGRFFVEFISRYFLRLGILDGYEGSLYALISSLYAVIKYAKLKELLDTTEGSAKKISSADLQP